MDPYLERPQWFGALHNLMIAYATESLQATLPVQYFATLGERVWVETTRMVEPDVHLRYQATELRGPDESPGGVATAVATLPIVITVPQENKDDEHRQPFIEIRAIEDDERLVTLIEMLSPSNKRPGPGRELYLQKQREALAGQVHLVEIDLLRRGEHTTAVPFQHMLAKSGSSDYHVCIHRFDRPDDYLLYPVPLADPLPTIEVPLLPGDGDVQLDLQQIFTRAYDAGPHRRRIAYGTDDIIPPLDDRQLEWARQITAGAQTH
jgi:hypothetical protein